MKMFMYYTLPARPRYEKIARNALVRISCAILPELWAKWKIELRPFYQEFKEMFH